MSDNRVTTWIVEQVNDFTGEIVKNEFKSYSEAQSVYCDLSEKLYEKNDRSVRVSIVKEEKHLLKE